MKRNDEDLYFSEQQLNARERAQMKRISTAKGNRAASKFELQPFDRYESKQKESKGIGIFFFFFFSIVRQRTSESSRLAAFFHAKRMQFVIKMPALAKNKPRLCNDL